MTRRRRILCSALASVVAAIALLFVPEADPTVPQDPPRAANAAFAWSQDPVWHELERQFVEFRARGCAAVAPARETLAGRTRDLLAALSERPFSPGDTVFRELESALFGLAPMVAACPEALAEYTGLVARSRSVVKRQSEHWDLADRQSRDTLYRLLYGGRQAVEEALLQAPVHASGLEPLVPGSDEPSATPWTTLLGARVHSGDILVSRGGAPTSALIARGNDFPGNFSHIALVYVHPKTRLASITEAHIERGVVVSTPDDYLRDTKLRVMVLRLRADLPALARDPMLPHRAAEAMLARVRAGHIPYDFEMDFKEPGKLFCSEVASSAYATHGVKLWMGLSHISSPGLRRWLAAFGVRHFETEEPSDLEYDPQLRVVAEWRDPDVLRKDHVDNAATDAMVADAERGAPLQYAWRMLPAARVTKAYSACRTWLGGVGPVPEGMSATSALRNKWYSARHAAITAQVTDRAADLRRRSGYFPPYWELVRLAREANASLR